MESRQLRLRLVTIEPGGVFGPGSQPNRQPGHRPHAARDGHRHWRWSCHGPWVGSRLARGKKRHMLAPQQRRSSGSADPGRHDRARESALKAVNAGTQPAALELGLEPTREPPAPGFVIDRLAALGRNTFNNCSGSSEQRAHACRVSSPHYCAGGHEPCSCIWPAMGRIRVRRRPEVVWHRQRRRHPFRHSCGARAREPRAAFFAYPRLGEAPPRYKSKRVGGPA